MGDIDIHISSTVDPENEYTPYEQRPETYIVPVLFFIIFIVGVLGNGTLVVIFLRHRAMRNVPNTNTFTTEGTKICPVVKIIIYQVWYPFNTDKYHWIATINDSVFYMTMVVVITYTKLLMISVTTFMLGQIKILQEMLQNIDKDTPEEKAIMEVEYQENLVIALKHCIKRHQELERLMKLLQSSTSSIILTLYFGSTFEMAAFLIQMITERSLYNIIRPFFVFMMTTLQVYIFYWFANEVQLESAAVSDVIYNDINWIDQPKLREYLLLMMTKSQKNLSFRAVAIGDMSLATFTKLMKLCYSVVAFFKTAYNL